MKAPSPLLGFNNNVRHRGRVFHIQTEDSGIRHPHIITHLFADGGRILKTIKTSYAEHLGQERIADTVRAMMQEQHKAMFIALRDGQYDPLIDATGQRSSRANIEAIGASGAADAKKVPPATPSSGGSGGAPGAFGGPIPAPAPSSPSAAGGSESGPVSLAPPAVHAAVEAPPTPAPAPQGRSPLAVPAPAPSPTKTLPHVETRDARDEARRESLRATPSQRIEVGHPSHVRTSPESGPAPSSGRRSGRPTLDVDPSAIHRAAAGARAWDSPGTATIGSEPDVDLDALERAAAESQGAQGQGYQQIQNLPPPPASVLVGKRGTGGYSSRTPPPPPVARRVFTPGGRPAIPSPNRYAPSRPASIFSTSRPPDGASIFGEDLISEKSLDEVILSYLAEDLEGPGEKK